MISKPFKIFDQQVNIFRTEIGFLEKLNLENDLYYDLEFYYLINYDKCERNFVKLEVNLFDDEYFKGTLFSSNDPNKPSVENYKWTKLQQCFQVLGKEYTLSIEIESACDNPNVFVSLDGIVVYEFNKTESSERECLDTQATYGPEVTYIKLTTEVTDYEMTKTLTTTKESTETTSTTTSTTTTTTTEESETHQATSTVEETKYEETTAYPITKTQESTSPIETRPTNVTTTTTTTIRATILPGFFSLSLKQDINNFQELYFLTYLPVFSNYTTKVRELVILENNNNARCPQMSELEDLTNEV
jgi:hypothetical protein